jgi:hypothetical protein
MPALLSQTGCFDALGNAAVGLIPYWVRAPLWSDGADKRRFLALPEGKSATLDAGGDFLLPVGTVLVKEFWFETVRIETRLFVHYADGYWAGYSYAWVDDDGAPLADARLLPDSEQPTTRDVSDADRTWTYPTRAQCLGCHSEAANRSLGVHVGQLNFDVTYPSGANANQLYTLWSLGLVEGNIAQFGARAFPAYDDASVPLESRVWSYLSSNCSGCHFRVGGRGALGRSQMPDVRYDLMADPLDASGLASRLCGLTSTAGDIGLGPDAPLVEPGNPGDWSDLSAGGSVLYLRLAARDDILGSTGAMPPLGTAVADRDGALSLVSAWIRELRCP